MLLMVIEAVRRRRLSENYSLVWLLMVGILVILSMWREGLDLLAGLIGIFYPPSALFVVGFGAVMLILFRFSIAISQLSDQNRQLAQKLAFLEWELRGQPADLEQLPAD
jgi:hypothetical protein